MPAKFFPAPNPYGASPAANVLNPTQPAAQNAQQPLLPPNFQDPGTMAQGATQQPAAGNPFAPGGTSNPVGRQNPFSQMFGRGLF